MSQTANRVIKNTGFLYAKMGITMFISLYTTRLILNALGASDFGIFNIVGGAIAMLGFLNGAMAGATQRFMSYSEGAGDKEKQKKIFNISFILHFAIAILMAVVLLIAGYFFFNGILNIAPERMYAAKVVYTSLIVSTIFTVMTVPYDAVLNAHENMLYYSIVGIVESLLKLGAAVAVVYAAGDKLVLYGILMACIPLITMTIMRIYSHKNYTECVIAPKRYWDKSLMKEMTSFAGFNLISSASSIVTMQGMAIIMNHYFGVVANAAHGVANQLSGQLMAFSNNMLKALTPIIVKSEGAANRKNMLYATIIGNKFSFLLFSVFAIPIIILAPIILELWLKEIPNFTIIFTRLVLIRIMLSQLFVTFSTSIGATGKIKSYIIFDTFFWFLTLPTSVLFYMLDFPVYSIYLILIVFVILRLIYSTIFMNKLCGLDIKDYLFKTVLGCFLASICSFVLGFLAYFYTEQYILRIFLVFILTFLSLVSLFYFSVISSDERKLVKELLQKLFKKL